MVGVLRRDLLDAGRDALHRPDLCLARRAALLPSQAAFLAFRTPSRLRALSCLSAVARVATSLLALRPPPCPWSLAPVRPLPSAALSVSLTVPYPPSAAARALALPVRLPILCCCLRLCFFRAPAACSRCLCPGPSLAPAPPTRRPCLCPSHAPAPPLPRLPPSLVCPRAPVPPRFAPCSARSLSPPRPCPGSLCSPALSCPAWTRRCCTCGSVMSMGVHSGAGA